jgi:putative phosphoesterase
MGILILSDIHANLPALDAILTRESSFDEVIFLGDAVVAGPYPEEVVTLLSSLGGAFIIGNHDREVLELDPNRPEADPHKLWMQWTRKQLSDKSISFLRSLPETCIVERQGLVMRLVHGVLPPQFGKRLWPDSSPEAFAFLTNQYPEQYILVGHSHVQFRKTLRGVEFVNPGTVGAPYLGQALACYAVLRNGQVDLRAISYDVEITCEAMNRVALQDKDFIDAWKTCWRTGKLPARYKIRDYSPLIEMGYR